MGSPTPSLPERLCAVLSQELADRRRRRAQEKRTQPRKVMEAQRNQEALKRDRVFETFLWFNPFSLHTMTATRDKAVSDFRFGG
jgi:hypothetical protein